MTKQEKIQESYGEYWEASKRYIDHKNGTIANKDRNFDIHNGFFEEVKIDGENRFRPKSLRGIENNNGWVKIESEDYLPKESGVYEACINEEYIGRINFSKEFNEWSCIYDSDNLRFPTHYQPIQKPLLPIY